MTYKPVRYSDHASHERSRREISREMVRETLSVGTPFQVATEPGSRYLGKERDFGRRTVQVIYLEGAHGIYVISVMWAGEERRTRKERDQ